MSLLWSWLSPTKKPDQPVRIPTDDVIQLSALDKSWMMRSLHMNWSFRFNKVLDNVKLQQALEQLITTGSNWRKLGGRFRLGAGGELELHVPKVFSASRPPVQFTSETHKVSVSEHTLDQTLPSSWEKPCLLDVPESLDDILAGPDAPTCLDDWLYTDRPGLVVHVINFTDSTFITLTYSHCLVDGVGKSQILLNWCLVLSDRMSDVKPMAEFIEDPVPSVTECLPQEKNEAYIHEERRLVGWRKYLFVFRMICYLFENPRRRQRNLFIPASTVDKIRTRVHETHPDDRLSDNQILTAWLVRLACSQFKSSDVPLGVTSAIDLRAFAFEGVRPDVVYLQNLLAYTWTNTTSSLLLRQPLGVAASLLRSSLKQQLSLGQVRAAARLTYTAMATTGSPYVFTDKNSFVVSVSSLAKAKYWDIVDFGPAVIGEDESSRRSCKPVWQCSTPRSSFKPPCLIVIQGKDLLGHWWAQMVLSDKVWDMILVELQNW